jgi:hypothetical protein
LESARLNRSRGPHRTSIGHAGIDHRWQDEDEILVKEVALLKKRVIEKDVPAVRAPCRLSASMATWQLAAHFMGIVLAAADEGDPCSTDLLRDAGQGCGIRAY